MKKDFSYTTEEGNVIPITLYGADTFGERPCILYIHGFKGFKDWGFVPFAGEYFSRNGFSFLAFNFSHNGIGNNPLEFTEFQKFELNTLSLEVREAKELIHLCTHTNFFGADLGGKLGVLGHSRGGGIALLAVQQPAGISAVTTWAAVSNFERYSKKQRQSWRTNRYIEVKNTRTGQTFRLGMGMLDDIEKHGKTTLNVLNAVKNLGKPLLIVHGGEDETVPYFEAEHLNIYGNPDMTQLRLIPKGTHTFGAQHPFVGATEPLESALAVTLDFFKHYLA